MVREGRLASTVQVALGDPPAVNCVHPTDEQIDAFVLNLRLFIQSGECGGENISFRRIAVSFATLPLSADIKTEFARLRDDLNRWLDSQSLLGFGGEPLSNRRILEVFVYGDLAHINSAEKRSTHESWAAALYFYPLLKTQFVFVIGKSMEFLRSGSALCERALAELETEDPISS
jgi:hypothetical protein